MILHGKAGVMHLQRKFGLKQDGIFGPVTAKNIMLRFDLGRSEAAHFLGQCAHESGNWRSFEENLNYTAEALLAKFRSRITREEAYMFGRIPGKQSANKTAIANIIYGGEWGRKNLGNTQAGDGWKYRGRGAIQYTGRANVERLSKFFNDPLILEDPDRINTHYLLDSAHAYFEKNGLWRFMDNISKSSIEVVTRRVNGGTFGLDDRIAKTNLYHSWLG